MPSDRSFRHRLAAVAFPHQHASRCSIAGSCSQPGQLRDAKTLRSETERLIASPGFERFVRTSPTTGSNLRHIRRDEPDIRLYPEYRFDDYLVESMELETRASSRR